MKTKPPGFALPPAPLRVLIVDDHAPTLAAIASILASEYPLIEVVGTADSDDAALRMARQAAPDVVVLDLHLGSRYGLDLVPAITNDGAEVIVFSSSDHLAERQRARAAGVAAFVSKHLPARELVAAVLATHRRGAVRI